MQITEGNSLTPMLQHHKLQAKHHLSRSKNDSLAKKPCYRVQFSNVQFYRWLLKIGLFPAKTYTIGKLKIVDRYFKDFLRGHLDGDGSIITYKDFYNTYKNPKYIYTRLWVNFISASGIHIKWLRKKIFNLLSINGHLSQGKIYNKQTVGRWKLKFAKKESKKKENYCRESFRENYKRKKTQIYEG